jgi:hypothetical protein
LTRFHAFGGILILASFTTSFLKPYVQNIRDLITADIASWPQKFDIQKAQSDTQAYTADEFCSVLP